MFTHNYTFLSGTVGIVSGGTLISGALWCSLGTFCCYNAGIL